MPKLRRLFTLLCLAIIGVTLPACGGDDDGAKGGIAGEAGKAGFETLMKRFLAGPKDTAALTQQLRPGAGDYAKVFVGDAAGKVKESNEKLLARDDANLRGNPLQTEIQVFAITTEQLQKKSAESREWPGGYLSRAHHFKPGVTFHMVRFVEPGKTSGMRFDVFVNIDGRWVFFAKPWRALAEK